MTPSSTSEPQPADVGRDHRRAARGGFERDEPERLGARRDDAHVGGAVVVGELVVRLRRDEAHAVLEPELGDQRVQRCDLGLAVGAARAADDHERGAVLVEHLGQRAHREVGALQRLDATDEQQRPARRGGRACRRAAARSPGENTVVVDAGRDDLDALGIGAVVAHELVVLLVRRRDDEIGAAHDLGFDAWAQRHRRRPVRPRPSPGRACGTW